MSGRIQQSKYVCLGYDEHEKLEAAFVVSINNFNHSDVVKNVYTDGIIFAS